MVPVVGLSKLINEGNFLLLRNSTEILEGMYAPGYVSLEQAQEITPTPVPSGEAGQKVQEGREAEHSAGTRGNEFQGVIPYLLPLTRSKATPRTGRHYRKLRIREDWLE
jgi:hypothetical protein